jgi:formate hydrogenlyase subunit 3/multisubunit Na+/H+ antiporter MnhD subunit
MILLFVASIVAVALILFFGKKLKPKMRVALVVLALLLVNLPTIVFLVVGDKPLPGARTVTQEELQGAAKQ